MDTEPVIWGIHGGHTGDANTLFLKGRYIALGWHEMGNLAILAPRRDAFQGASRSSVLGGETG